MTTNQKLPNTLYDYTTTSRRVFIAEFPCSCKYCNAVKREKITPNYYDRVSDASGEVAISPHDTSIGTAVLDINQVYDCELQWLIPIGSQIDSIAGLLVGKIDSSSGDSYRLQTFVDKKYRSRYFIRVETVSVVKDITPRDTHPILWSREHSKSYYDP